MKPSITSCRAGVVLSQLAEARITARCVRSGVQSYERLRDSQRNQLTFYPINLAVQEIGVALTIYLSPQ